MRRSREIEPRHARGEARSSEPRDGGGDEEVLRLWGEMGRPEEMSGDGGGDEEVLRLWGERWGDLRRCREMAAGMRRPCAVFETRTIVSRSMKDLPRHFLDTC